MQAPGQTLEKRKGAEFVKAEIVGTPSNHSDPMATLSKLFSVYETPLAPNASNWARWLAEDVALIIVPEERAAFLRLTDDAEREHFITQFWQRRNPEGRDAARNRFKDEHYRRIRYANERFAKADVPGCQTDRGRLYIVMGPPDEMEVHPGEQREVWTYRRFNDTPDMLSITFRI
jgi:GWxTD domain-containing protein